MGFTCKVYFIWDSKPIWWVDIANFLWYLSDSTYEYSYSYVRVQTLCTLHVQQICKEDTIPQRFMQEPLTVLIAIKILSRCINHKRKNKRTNKKSHPFRLWHNIRNSGNNRRNLSNRMLLRKKKMYSTVNLAQQRRSCCDFQTQERWSTAKSLITKNTPPPRIWKWWRHMLFPCKIP